MSEPLHLPERLDLAAATKLATDLRAMDGDITLDASQVKHLGALCLQTLVAASRKAKAGGHSFALTDTPEKVLHQLEFMGASPEQLREGAL
ncbi:anti-sigma factor antagonist [Aliishimia ponticola]|uniref:Anti-sigma factor antagonist n=1 Tax=Aliishimia ponticola TaxID=2499833 RepID=A0A4S4NID9_9RHOB|nr:STAS domain-containing protein [Aliishimia ponticola]THH38477.1 anti-sigma factor antagonist [Aliishimia ponticola]